MLKLSSQTDPNFDLRSVCDLWTVNREKAADDAQIRANEYVIRAGELELVANPVQFDVTPPHTGPAPGFGSQAATSRSLPACAF